MFRRERFLSCPSFDRWFLGEMMERGFWLNMDDVDMTGLYGLRLDAPVDGARDSRDRLGAPDDVSLVRPRPADAKFCSSHIEDDGSCEPSIDESPDWSTGLSVCAMLATCTTEL